MSNHLFIKACFNKPIPRTPVWMMRQAGRYLPEYRAIRRHYDFTTMYKTPDLVTEVTLQPVDIVGVDAAILFSDILVIPEAMGLGLAFYEGKGPVFAEPIRDEADFSRLHKIDAEEQLGYVLTSIKQIQNELNGRVPLIGFCGAPWTIATYMIEGQGSKNHQNAKRWRYARPDLLHRLLKLITTASIDYCRAQIEAGAQAIQIFDSWAGALDQPGFEEFALAYTRQIVDAIKQPGIPTIYFAKGAMGWLDMLPQSGADVLGLDWSINLDDARRRVGDKAALQGNLDPTALYAPPDQIRSMVKAMLERYGAGSGHVANLGHGILPDIPVPQAKAFVDAVKELSPMYH